MSEEAFFSCPPIFILWVGGGSSSVLWTVRERASRERKDDPVHKTIAEDIGDLD